MRFVDRVAHKLDFFGETFSVNGNACQGMFKLLDTGTMRLYLDDIESMGITHPALALVTTPDANVDVGDSISRDDRSYTVLKIATHRIGGNAVIKIAILS